MTEAEEKFVASVTTAIEDVALAFAYELDDRVATSLEQMRANLKAKYANLFPSIPGTTSAMVDHIIECIQTRRREIEAAGEMPPVVLN
jgi:hypothetical protein